MHNLDKIPTAVKEVSVKSLSMAMGVRKPGFQLLSLFTSPSHDRSQTLLDTPCHLPDQLGIYLSVYVPLIVISFLILIITNVLRVRGADAYPRQPQARSRRHSDEWTSDSPVNIRFARSRMDVEAGGKVWSRPSLDDDPPPETPGPASTFLPPPNPSHSKGRTKCKRVVGGFGADVFKVAIYPLSLWIVITWRTFSAE